MNINDEIERMEENQDLIDRVNHCQHNNAELNGWEDDFLDSIEEQLEKGRTLTSRQLEKLEQIEIIVTEGRDFAYDSDGF